MLAEVLGDPLLGDLLRYWIAKRGDREFPPRHEIDPVEMGARLLPNLMLCDLLEGGARVRFRLVGTFIVGRFGADPTGQYLGDQLGCDYLELLATLHRLVFMRRAPVYSASAFRSVGAAALEARHLLLPLTNGGADPAIALVGIAFCSGDPWPQHLRLLDDRGGHIELRRSVLTLPNARNSGRAPG